jgi:hypothetical protein
MNIKKKVALGVVGAVLGSSGVASAVTCTTGTTLMTTASTIVNYCGAGYAYFVLNTSVEVDLVAPAPTPSTINYYGARVRAYTSGGSEIAGCVAFDNVRTNGWVGDFSGCGDAVKWKGFVYYDPPIH